MGRLLSLVYCDSNLDPRVKVVAVAIMAILVLVALVKLAINYLHQSQGYARFRRATETPQTLENQQNSSRGTREESSDLENPSLTRSNSSRPLTNLFSTGLFAAEESKDSLRAQEAQEAIDAFKGSTAYKEQEPHSKFIVIRRRPMPGSLGEIRWEYKNLKLNQLEVGDEIQLPSGTSFIYNDNNNDDLDHIRELFSG